MQKLTQNGVRPFFIKTCKAFILLALVLFVSTSYAQNITYETHFAYGFSFWPTQNDAKIKADKFGFSYVNLGKTGHIASIDLPNPIMEISFIYQLRDMNNGEGFHVEVSVDGGPYQIAKSFVRGNDINNKKYYEGRAEFYSSHDEFPSGSGKTLKVRIRADGNEKGESVRLRLITLKTLVRAIPFPQETARTTSTITTPVTALSVFPNAVSSTSTVQVTLATDNQVNVQLLDKSGKLVKTLNTGALTKGNHKFNLSKAGLNPGLYFLQVKVGGETLTKRVIID